MTDWTSTVTFRGIEQALTSAAVRATQRIGEHVMDGAQAILPEEDGTLGRSGTVTTEDAGGVATTAVAFDTPYAVRQHERLDYHHEPGESAKYLETPFVEASDGAAAALAADEMRKALR